MSYWGDGVDECDYAFGSIGATISWIKDRMLSGASTVINKGHPEQGILASLSCLRILGERYPKNLSVHFGRRDLMRTRQLFDQWHELVKGQLPAERWDALRALADREFALFEERIIDGREAQGRSDPS